jgi:hypothetical protein
MTKAGLSFTRQNAPGMPVTLTVGTNTVTGWDTAKWQSALTAAGYPAKADPAKINYAMVELVLVIMVLYVSRRVGKATSSGCSHVAATTGAAVTRRLRSPRPGYAPGRSRPCSRMSWTPGMSDGDPTSPGSMLRTTRAGLPAAKQ